MLNTFLANVKSRFFPTRVAYVWAVVFIGIVLYAMTWYIFGWVIMEVVAAVEASYTFTGPLATVVTIIKYVIAFHPIMALFGWIIWGYINSSRRSVREYEY